MVTNVDYVLLFHAQRTPKNFELILKKKEKSNSGTELQLMPCRLQMISEVY